MPRIKNKERARWPWWMAVFTALAGAALTVPLGAVPASAEAPEQDHQFVSILGRMIELDVFLKAYERVRHVYVVDPGSQDRKTAAELGAMHVSGEIVQLSGQFCVLDLGDRFIAVRQLRGINPDTNKPADLMVVPARSGGYSYRLRDGERRSLRQYTDVSMSVNDFLRYLRAGYHFPQAPELGTNPDSRGLFERRYRHRDRLEAHMRNNPPPEFEYD